MARINKEGSIQARCPGCDGALASFEWKSNISPFGNVFKIVEGERGSVVQDYRLYRCAGCGRGALGVIRYSRGTTFPDGYLDLRWFSPEAKERLKLPKDVPQGIQKEFREGEQCMEAGCLRAAAGMFRSVLDKALRANGYKDKRGTTLEQQIDAAANDGVITQSRRKRAHDEIRVLGNDVLHDEWREVSEEDVRAAHMYAQRILEDLYDDRPSVLALLRQANRVPDEDRGVAAP